MSGNRYLAWGAIAGPVVLTAAWLVLGAMSPGYTLWGTRVAPYSPVSQPLSGLGLGPTGPYMNAAFILFGVAVSAGVVGIFRLIPGLTARARWACAGFLALPAAGAMLDGVFTFEHFLPHFIGFGLVLTTVVTFPAVGFVLRRIPWWRRLGNGLIAAGPLTLVLTVLYFATFTPTVEGIQHGIAGLTERMLIVEVQAWYVALAALALKRSSAGNELAFS
jgi:hypothetical protein